jgi:hypothetical protein
LSLCIKVVVYDGQPRGAGGPTSAANTAVVSASDLAAADVVGCCTGLGLRVYGLGLGFMVF